MQKPENTFDMNGSPIELPALEIILSIAQEYGEVHVVNITPKLNCLLELGAALAAIYNSAHGEMRDATLYL